MFGSNWGELDNLSPVIKREIQAIKDNELETPKNDTKNRKGRKIKFGDIIRGIRQRIIYN